MFAYRRKGGRKRGREGGDGREVGKGDGREVGNGDGRVVGKRDGRDVGKGMGGRWVRGWASFTFSLRAVIMKLGSYNSETANVSLVPRPFPPPVFDRLQYTNI